MKCGRALALLALLLMPLELAAQKPTTNEERAKAAFKEAADKFTAGDFAGALEGFQRAYDFVPRAKILLNIAAANAQLGREADVANAYQKYLDNPNHERDRAAQIRSLIAEIDPRVGRIKLVVAPDGAVAVNNTRVGKGPLTLLYRVKPGRHIVTATFATGAVTREVEVTQGQTITVKLSAPPKPRESEPQKDEQDEEEIVPPNDESPIYKKPWLYTGAGTAVTATIAIVFGLKAKGAESDYETLVASGMAEYRDAKEIEDRGKRHALITNLSLAGTGVLAAATGVFLWLDLRGSSGGGEEDASFAVVPLSEGGFIASEAWTF